ncbi:Type I restriction modification DNA specificity domain protein [Staphylococcus capitis subsp. capitis]|uniref:restriction endonuclease subunit S n=1 Tax=Staphylococcus capitis TaxID=29388 RepID=UPI000649682C|nr:restriction endonuclease subunit S [Staphylococcus capitis]AKL93081.1 Type I restriction modification DNA specificity domain protein [Staphylococcus capitis subsp. capitis]
MTEQNTPELRFTEFKGEWRKCKLADVVNVYDGTHQTPRYTKEGIRFLSVENIRSLKSNKFISKEDFEKEFKIYPEYGDILMTRIGDIGTPKVVNLIEPLAYYVSLALLKPININSYFLESLILSPTVQNELWRKTLHIAFPKKINKNEIAKVMINYPKNEEQEKIGKLFSKLDHQIELEEKKLELLEQQKKGYIQKVFSQELRFKDENGNDYPNWETSKIKELGSVYTGNTPSKKQTKYWDSIEYIWITPTDITEKKNVRSSEYMLSDKGFKKARQLPKNTLLITCIASIGKNAIMREEGSCNQQINALVPNDNNNVDFLYYAFEKVSKYMKRIAGRTATQIVNKSTFENISIEVPNFEVQLKIGRFLNSLDKLIEKQNSKVELLKQRKQGLLQKMFV